MNGMGQLQKVNLNRSTAKDLANGIQELEERGYELIKQGVEGKFDRGLRSR